MKKYVLIGITIVAVAFLSGAAVYASDGIGWTKNVYVVSGLKDAKSTVSRFRDGNKTCYVVSSNYHGDAVGISCVKD